ncbi:hypothetical protein M9458_016881, partial [Cirrhinus mrigala]
QSVIPDLPWSSLEFAQQQAADRTLPPGLVRSRHYDASPETVIETPSQSEGCRLVRSTDEIIAAACGNQCSDCTLPTTTGRDQHANRAQHPSGLDA